MPRHSVVSFLFTLVALCLGACASGSAIVTGAKRASTNPEQVNIYLEPPAEFEVVGLVNASSDAGWTEQGSMDYALQELKSQAAKIGANGVLLVSSGDKITTSYIMSGTVLVPFPVTAKTVQGRAIFVKKP